MSTYILVGELTIPGRVEVEADNLDEALSKAEHGDFTIFDMEKKFADFEFCDDTDGGVTVE